MLDVRDLHGNERRLSVEFGRIDYSVADDSVVTWEINTNAMLLSAPSQIAPARLALQGATRTRPAADSSRAARGAAELEPHALDRLGGAAQ
jgi:hypothetical protein